MKKNTKNLRKILLVLFIVIIVGGFWTLAPAAIANTPPVAYDVSVTTDEDTSLMVALTASDSDGDALTYSIVTPPIYGTLSGAGPELTYCPPAHWNGSDSFIYKANDGLADSNLATVAITVNPVNDPPVACDDYYATNEDNQLAVAAPGVLLNDYDIDDDELLAVLVTGVLHGTLTLDSDGSFTYMSNADYYGMDSFTYKAHDGLADSNLATVAITVNPVNDPPVAHDYSVIGHEDMLLGITLTASDSDGDALTYSIVTPPIYGTLSGVGPELTYCPHAHWNGPDSFTYKAHDGFADSNLATVNITVNPLNDPPVADANGPYTGYVDLPITFDGTHSFDIDGDALTYSWDFNDVTTSTGQTPTHVYFLSGIYTVTLTVSDGYLESDPCTTVVTVTSNDPPVADANGPYSGLVGSPITFDGTLSFDPDGDALTYLWDFGDGSTGTGEHPQHSYDVPGVYTVTLTVSDGWITDCDDTTVDVTSQVLTSIAILPLSVTLCVGEQQHFTVTAYDQMGNVIGGVTFTWAVDDDTIGTINANGLFTALAVGTTTIEAVSGGVSATADVTVEDCKPPEIVGVIQSSEEPCAGEPVYIWAHVTDDVGVTNVSLNVTGPHWYLMHPMTLVDGTATDGWWELGIDGQPASTTLTLQVFAWDDAGNTNCSNPHQKLWKECIPKIDLKKYASPAVVAPGGNVTYTIIYSNTEGVAHDVVITESYPKDVTFISADPAPDTGTNNRWTIGTLSSVSSWKIIIKLKVPELQNFSFSERGGVSGEGLVVVSKELSTEQESYSLRNVVTLTCAELDPVRASAVTTVSGVPGTQTSLTEHGSGMYSSVNRI